MHKLTEVWKSTTEGNQVPTYNSQLYIAEAPSPVCEWMSNSLFLTSGIQSHRDNAHQSPKISPNQPQNKKQAEN